MEIVASTFIALAAAALLLALGPRRGLWVFLAVTPLGAAAALNLPAVGGATIGVIDVAAMALFLAVALSPDAAARLAGTLRIGQPGFYLLMLALFAVFASAVFPRLFAGQTIVFGLARADNTAGIVSLPLRPSTGNITQLVRLLLDVLVFLAVATAFRARPEPQWIVAGLGVATAVHFVLGWADVLTYRAGLEALLEPIRTANYAITVDVQMVGIKRMIGGFPEASSFGYYSLGLFGFWLTYWVLVPRSWLALWGFLAATVVLLRSTSSSAYVAVVVFLLLMVAIALFFQLTRTVARRTALIWVIGFSLAWISGLLLFLAYELVQPINDYLDRAIFDKLETRSAEERGSWNAQAFQNFLDTLGLGAGLGSVRASSWLFGSLANLGVIGTALFVAFLASVVAAPATGDRQRDAVIRALKAGCLAQFISALLTHPTPDLGIFFFALAGAAVGLSRGGQLESGRLAPKMSVENWGRPVT